MPNSAGLQIIDRDAPVHGALSEADIKAKLEELAPFHHSVDLPYDLNTYSLTETHVTRNSRGRIDCLKRHLWPRLLEAYGGSLKGKRVLDVACNCGGFSVLAAESGADEVVGIDSEAKYIDQADFIKEARGLDNVRFETASIEDLSPETHGKFDIVFFFGILYHLEDPAGALRGISALTDDMIVVDTSLMRVPYINRFLRKPMWTMKIVSRIEHNDTTTGLWRKTRHCQFYPNKAAVEQILPFVGFNDVTYLKPNEKGLEQRYYSQRRGIFIGRKADAAERR